MRGAEYVDIVRRFQHRAFINTWLMKACKVGFHYYTI